MNSRILVSFSSLATEFRSVMRGLVRKPSYAIAAWVMLGLAIAANAAVFAIVWGFLLKPLPYAQPDQLAVVRERMPKAGLNVPMVSVKTYLALKKRLDGIGTAGLSTNPGAEPVTIADRTHLLHFEQVTPSLFQTLGSRPVLGRLPAPNVSQPGGPAETVISWRFWQGVYGGRQNVLGKRLQVNGKSYLIVGVMPRQFFFETGSPDAWLPLVITPKRAQDENINYWMVVRLKPGGSLQHLNLELQSLRPRVLAGKKPSERATYINNGYTIDARSLRAVLNEQFGIGQLPWLLQAAAGLLLLLALANTINLGLVRQRARQHEFALRRVLGASRGGLVRLILIEHLPIALVAGFTAMLLAWAGLGALQAFGLPSPSSPFHVALAPAVIIFTWVLAVLAILIVAFGPALLASGRGLLATLGHGPTAVGGHAARRLQRSLGVVQIALSCALVVAGGLLGVSLWGVLSQSVGFIPQHRIAATIVLPDNTKNTAAWATLKPQLLKLPGVDAAGATDMLPFSNYRVQGDVREANTGANTESIIVQLPSISADFFSSLGIKFLAGRAFTPSEVANDAPVTIINAALANRFFGGADKAVGQNIFRQKGHPLRIVGVTRDIAWDSTRDQYHPGTAYLTLNTFQLGLLVAVVQTRGPTKPLVTAFRHTIQNALPGSAISKVTAMPEVVQGASVFRAAGAGMVGAFAALALLLAALGVFAITSFIARARLGEYGIRAALGASPLALLRLGFREAGWLLAIGLPIGLIGAYLLGRVIAGALYQTPVLNPWLYIVGAVLIATVVFAAAWRPAHKAARVPVRNLLGGGGAQ